METTKLEFKEIQEVKDDIMLLKNIGNIPKITEQVILRKLNTIESKNKDLLEALQEILKDVPHYYDSRKKAEKAIQKSLK